MHIKSVILLKLHENEKHRIHYRGFLWRGIHRMGLGNDMLEFSTVFVMFYFQTKESITKQANMANIQECLSLSSIISIEKMSISIKISHS